MSFNFDAVAARIIKKPILLNKSNLSWWINGSGANNDKYKQQAAEVLIVMSQVLKESS
jgi:hypothetical protein